MRTLFSLIYAKDSTAILSSYNAVIPASSSSRNLILWTLWIAQSADLIKLVSRVCTMWHLSFSTLIIVFFAHGGHVFHAIGTSLFAVAAAPCVISI